MASHKPLKIGGQTIKLGQSKQIELQFSETYLGGKLSIPVYVLRGHRQGPRVFLTATIHGDELNGLGILRELLYGTPPPLKKGTLIIVPVLNSYGFENHTRYMPDRRDLNRSFPGSGDGSIAGRLANVIYNEIIKQCDYGIDFHTAAVRRTNFPNVRGDMTEPGVKMLAEAFGCELIVHGKGSQGTLRHTATNSGAPTIILEAGEIFKIEPGVVDIGVRGVLNVLKKLGMVKGELVDPPVQVTVRRTTWVRAEAGGLLSFHARPGDLVVKDQILATNSNIFGKEHRRMYSPVTGIVLGMATMPAVKPGEPVYHIAKLTKQSYRQMERYMERMTTHHVFNRIQEDLATNIIISDGE